MNRFAHPLAAKVSQFPIDGDAPANVDCRRSRISLRVAVFLIRGGDHFQLIGLVKLQ